MTKIKKDVFESNYPIDVCHSGALQKPPLLSYVKEDGYREKLRAKLKELLGNEPERVDPNLRILSKKDEGSYTISCLTFDSEKGVTVPGYLLVPKNVVKPPVVICLQGHSTGMHISIGRAKFKGDKKCISTGDRDFALIAVKNGYAAFVMEQRGFGLRESGQKGKTQADRCNFASMNALLVGRTMLGERIWDVSRAIDVLQTLSEVDGNKIACMGNSGGGTVTYYAAAMDERIKIAMPSCSVCSYFASIGSLKHCVCNYIPKAAEYFDMSDLAALIAPRPLVVVAGEKDDIFPAEGVKSNYAAIEKIYADFGAKENCALYMGSGGHRFYKAAYEVFNAFLSRV